MTPHFKAILLLIALVVALVFAPILAFAADELKLPPEVKAKCDAEGGCMLVSKAFLAALVKQAKAEQMQSIVNDLPAVQDNFGHCRLGGA